MDLTAAQQRSGKRWSWSKAAAALCFIAACGLLIGTLVKSPSTRLGAVTISNSASPSLHG